MSKSLYMPRLKTRPLEQSFTLDGNSLTFKAPKYEPLLDQHLKPFFFNVDRLKLLKRNKLINRKFEVIDQRINKKYRNEELMIRPSSEHLSIGSMKSDSLMFSPVKREFGS